MSRQSKEFRITEMYLYHYRANMLKLSEKREKLEVEYNHGDLKVQSYHNEVKNEGITRAVEDWHIKCERLCSEIDYLERATAGIKIMEEYLRMMSRLSRRYETMYDILQKVYYGGMRMPEYVQSSEKSEGTLYRRRKELVRLAGEYLRLL